MKIKYLEIKNYKQFTDLTLDLRYPKGHKKEGEPLDKICIIGQSGTGKTNLLEIIKKSTIDFSKQPENSYLPFSEFVGKDTDDRYIGTKFTIEENFNIETLFTSRTSKVTNTTKNNILKHEKNYFVSARKDVIQSEDELENNKMILKDIKSDKMSPSDKIVLSKLNNAKAELILESFQEEIKDPFHDPKHMYHYDDTRKTLEQIDFKIYEIEGKYKSALNVSTSLKKLKSNNFIDRWIININEINNSWKLLKERIDNYEDEKTKHIKYLSSQLLNDSNYSKNDYKKDMALWENQNENILEKIADDINSIIKKFNLELKLDETTNSYEELIIKDLATNTIIEYDDISTGTKNLLSTFIPLKSYNPEDSIILIDEPEMSFYPDIQKQLINLYSTVGNNNQLVVATHSPLIASSFEPWEVVELKFDKNNQIYREKYYEGENHIDNYTLDPRMLTWTGILTDIFDLQEDSNFTFREKKLMEYATLKAEIKAMKTMEEKEKKFKELQKISKILGLDN